MTTRREFLGGTAALFGATGAGATTVLEPARRSLDILFLGGTGFIGPHQINYALARGHTVSMFNRGRNAGLFGDRVEELIGNRDSRIDDGLAALQGDRTWDVVVDNSGYVPRHVRDSAELLSNRTQRYVYVSTVSVYDFEKVTHITPGSPLAAAPAEPTEEVNGRTYGPLKAECDRIVREVYGERATVVRPTYVIGPGDTTDRFTYWVERLHRGGDVVCPSPPDFDVNWIDVRDLCPWLISLAEDDVPGAFIAAGPASPMTNLELMHGLRASTAAPVRLHWPPAELLDELDYPTPMFSRSASISCDASESVAAGLTYTALADSARDLHEWWTSESPERRARARGWPSAAEEAAVLERLKA